MPLKREPSPPGAITDLFDRLHELHLDAGEPGVRQIATGSVHVEGASRPFALTPLTNRTTLPSDEVVRPAGFPGRPRHLARRGDTYQVHVG